MTDTPRLPPPLVKHAAALLHQQCWCWGCDIRHPAGNLLMEYGFVRHRHRARDASTTYLLSNESARVGLWGFGVAWMPASGAAIFSGRYSFLPVRMVTTESLEQVGRPSDLQLERRVPTAALWWSLIKLLRWIADYERWVARAAASSWRRDTLLQFSSKTVSDDPAAAWWHCAAALDTALWTSVRDSLRSPREQPRTAS